MNEIITVTYENDRPTISGRELHEKLGISTRYNDWFPRMCEYGFTEGEDFYSILSKTPDGGRPSTNHQLTIDMAKQICMIQRTDEGRRYREYFLEVERKWNSPEAVMARALQIADRKLEAATAVIEKQTETIAKLEPKAAYYDTVTESVGSMSFRDTAKMFGIKEKELIDFLLNQKMVYRNSMRRLTPYAEFTGKFFEVNEITYESASGTRATVYTKITPRGRQAIHNRLRKAGVIDG